MPIEQDLRERLTAAMKAKDLKTANVIRMVNTKIMERRTAKGFSGLVDDALCQDVISAYKKSLEKGIEEYSQLGEKGKEQIAELSWEINYCAQFLPKQLSKDELKIAVQSAIQKLGVTDVKMAGRVVGEVMKGHKGKTDAGVVKKLVEQLLPP